MGKSLPRQRKHDFISQVVKRSGICRATCEQVAPAVIDEIRYQLAEGKLFVAIESFGTFTVKELPLRQHLYTYKGKTELRTLQPKKVIKFAPTRNFRQEVQAGQYDPEYRAFVHHPKAPKLRTRSAARYQPNQEMHRGVTTIVKSENPD